MEIRMARGDLVTKTFRLLKKDKTTYETEPDEIYFTVKTVASECDFKFQKRLSRGEIIRVEQGKYQFTILPQDTDGLLFSNYDFDIEIVKEGTLKRTFTGQLVLTKEVTHACNEGAV